MIAIIDYGLGNTNSVLKAFQHIGATTFIAKTPEDLNKASKIVLPGVGSFNDAMKNLKQKKFLTMLDQQIITEKKYFLGICLGMHLTANIGFEGGKINGFSWIKDSVVNKFNTIAPLKTPHIGWNEICIINDKNFLFKNIKNKSNFYFVHSYHYNFNQKYTTATCNHGYDFPAAIQKNNIFAVQFHPEKSQKVGLQLLTNFNNL